MLDNRDIYAEENEEESGISEKKMGEYTQKSCGIHVMNSRGISVRANVKGSREEIKQRFEEHLKKECTHPLKFVGADENEEIFYIRVNQDTVFISIGKEVIISRRIHTRGLN